MGYHPNLLLQYSTCILSSLQNEAPRTGKKPSNSLERGSKEASRPAWKVPKPHVGTMGANSIGGRPQIRRTRPGGDGRRGEFLTSSFNTPTATFGTWLAEGRRKMPAADNWFPPSGRDGRTLWTGRARPPKKNQILSCPQTAHSVPVRHSESRTPSGAENVLWQT